MSLKGFSPRQQLEYVLESVHGRSYTEKGPFLKSTGVPEWVYRALMSGRWPPRGWSGQLTDGAIALFRGMVKLARKKDPDGYLGLDTEAWVDALWRQRTRYLEGQTERQRPQQEMLRKRMHEAYRP